MFVDIIIPIYNSPIETKACIQSVIDSTPYGSYRLYLLDDCSPNIDINEITNYYSSTFDHIYAYRHTKNKGFPLNVNFGLEITENDVVILNSDTLVTSGWLNALYQAAKENNNVAAVGPLSNYGVMTSVPSIYPEINNNISIEQIVNYIKENKSNSYHQSPVLTGFCMYLTRNAINQVGIFDSETFGKGYGEEIDWCLRARDKGLKLIITENCYVYHEGGISFGDEKNVLQEHATKIINIRYPDYNQELYKFHLNHPLLKTRKKMARDLKVPYKYRIRYLLSLKKFRLENILKK